MPITIFDTVKDIANETLFEPPSINSFSELAAVGLNLIIGVGFSLSIVALAYSAYLYVLSGGTPENTKRAWNAFLWGAIGGAIIIGSVALKNLVINAFGVPIAELQTPTPGF